LYLKLFNVTGVNVPAADRRRHGTGHLAPARSAFACRVEAVGEVLGSSSRLEVCGVAAGLEVAEVTDVDGAGRRLGQPVCQGVGDEERGGRPDQVAAEADASVVGHRCPTEGPTFAGLAAVDQVPESGDASPPTFRQFFPAVSLRCCCPVSARTPGEVSIRAAGHKVADGHGNHVQSSGNL